MTKVINIHEAKTHLSRIVEEVAAGKEVIIAKAGKPMARLVPMRRAVTKKHLGLLKGKIKIPPDFNRPLPETVVQLFERD
ncbi:MAG TPA: type II toxin-antitoxin system Phd/YefM family antitoxin [Steroidobacteraceae bacterium]|nr:type II toxin-antitoxin system Phd/YefM family antitoxin [Steroidobacteraceae bacterium]